VDDIHDKKAAKLNYTIHQLSVENSLLKSKIKGLHNTLEQEK
jgi:hypothetical protein